MTLVTYLINVAERVERSSLISLCSISPGTKVSREQLHIGRYIALSDHVLDWGFDSGGLDGVELAKCEAQEAAGPSIRDELGG
jgi:hypothetical protein